MLSRTRVRIKRSRAKKKTANRWVSLLLLLLEVWRHSRCMNMSEKKMAPTLLCWTSECSGSDVVAPSEWQTSQRRSVVKTTSVFVPLDSSATAESRWPQPVADFITASHINTLFVSLRACARACVLVCFHVGERWASTEAHSKYWQEEHIFPLTNTLPTITI